MNKVSELKDGESMILESDDKGVLRFDESLFIAPDVKIDLLKPLKVTNENGNFVLRNEGVK